ncbi:MAG TPA: alpha/beta fold hydrolase [Anaerolineae bacterium]|nr:alpha/beta fold hydrolase [Anaerolineae bacterium]
MRFTSHGISFEYDDVGNGIPLLMIHGFPLDRSVWRSQIEGLQSVARVIAPDLRGFGQSGDAPETMTMDDYAADLKALLDALSLARAVVCGLSMGGYVALAFLARYPGAVKGLILANTRAAADSDQAREARYANASKAYDGGVPSIAEAMLPKMLTEATLDHRPTLRTYVYAMIARQPPGGVAAALRGMAARPDRSEWIKSINVPTLIITGSADTLIPAAESEAMARAIPGSKLVVIPGVAHLSNIENPDAFNAAVKEFVGKLR